MSQSRNVRGQAPSASNRQEQRSVRPEEHSPLNDRPGRSFQWRQKASVKSSSSFSRREREKDLGIAYRTRIREVGTEEGFITAHAREIPQSDLSDMALGAEQPAAVLAKELRECREKLSNLNECLQNERKLSEIKERTIQNQRQEIRIIDKDASDKKREIEKLNETLQRMRSKVTELETENKVLENQGKMMEDSNRRLHKELHEVINTLRLRETKAEEVEVKRADAARNYTRVLQSTIDKFIRFNYFLQQVEAEFLSRDASYKRLQAQRQTIEEVLMEKNVENKRYPEHGWYGLFPLRAHSHVLLDDERESLRKELVKVGVRDASLDNDSFVDNLAEVIETRIVEGLKTRLSVQDDAITEAQNKLRSARAEVRELKRFEDEQVDGAKRMEEKVRLRRSLLEQELKELSDELSSAQALKKEDEEKVKPRRKFSEGSDSRIRSLSSAGRTSRAEIMEIKKAICSMSAKTEVTNNPLSDMEERILSLNKKVTKLMEEKLELAEELIESQKNLINLENLLDSRNQENSALSKELSSKVKQLQGTEMNLQEVFKCRIELEYELDATNRELQQTKKEAQSFKTKLNERAHRVELQFTPNSQSGNEQLVESLREDLSNARRNGELSPKDVAHKAVQVNENGASQSVLYRRDSNKKRRNSFEGIPRLRLVSKADLKLTYRCDKETQADADMEETHGIETALKDAIRGKEEMEKLNQSLVARIGRREKEMDRFTNQVEELQNTDPGLRNRITGLWSTLVELRQAKDEEEKKSNELKGELERFEEGRRKKEAVAHAEIIQNYKEDLLDIQEALGNALVDKEVLRKKKEDLEEEVKRKDSQIEKLTCDVKRKEECAKEKQELQLELKGKGAKVEENSQTKVEKNKESYGNKIFTPSTQQSAMLKMRKKVEDLERRNEQVEKELEKQNKLIDSLRFERRDPQCEEELPLEESDRLKVELVELQQTVESTILQKEDVEKKLRNLRDELQRRATALEAQENEFYEAQTSELRKTIEKTLEEKVAVEKEIEHLQEKIYRRRMSSITAEEDEHQRRQSLGYSEGLNNCKFISDLREAVEKAQEHEKRSTTRMRELEKELSDKRKICQPSGGQSQSRESHTTCSLPALGTEKGNAEDKRLRQELLSQENETLRKRVEIREKNLETKVKEVAQKEFLIQKIIQDKNREMEEMEVKFRCRLQEQLEKLHKELTDGNSPFSEIDSKTAKEENFSLKEKLAKLYVQLNSQEEMERELEVSKQTRKDLEAVVDALEREKVYLEDQNKDLKRRASELGYQQEVNKQELGQLIEKSSLSEEKCRLLESTLENLRRSESELTRQTQRLVEENSRQMLRNERLDKVENELTESKEKYRAAEENKRTLRQENSTLKDQVEVLRQRSTSLENEKLWRDEAIRNLETKLDNVVAERNSTIAGEL